MVTEPTQIDGGVLDLVLADVSDVGVRVGSPVGAQDHSTAFVNVVLEQPIPRVVSRQVVYLRNSVEWELMRGDVNGRSWNRIIRSPCLASLLNETLLRVVRDSFQLSHRGCKPAQLYTGAKPG